MSNIENALIEGTMLGMAEREKVIRGLECHATKGFVACQDCPYYPDELIYEDDDDMEGTICEEKLAADAIALLKEQGPRVLAYPEIVSFDGVVWIETIGAQNVVRAICNGYVVTHDLLAFSAKSGSPVGMVDDYYKRWRCWTSRPTPEQMRDTPWEGESNAETS